MIFSDRRKRPSGALYFVPVVIVLIGLALSPYPFSQLQKSDQPPRKYFAVTKRIAVPHPIRFALCFQDRGHRDDMFTKERVEERLGAAVFAFVNEETGREARVTALRGQEVYTEWGILFHGLEMERILLFGMQLAVVEIDAPGVYAFTVSGRTDDPGSGRFAACEIPPDKTLHSALLIAALAVVILGGVGSTIVIYRRRAAQAGRRSRRAALFLAVFGGLAGLDRFYLGYSGIGLLKLLTGGLFSVLWIGDIIKIAKGNMLDKQGHRLE